MNYKKPNIFFYRLTQGLAWFIATFVFHRKFVRNEIKGKKGPFVVIANHQAKLDFTTLIGATSRPMSIVVSNSFYQSMPIKKLLDYLGMIPKQQFQTTITDLKNAENLVNGSTVRTLGYNTYNDGGGAFYKVRTVTNDDVENDMDIIELYDNYLVAELLTDGKLNVKTFGAVGDGVFDNTDIIREAIAYCKRKNTSLYFPIGIYNVNGNYTIDFSLKIEGDHVGNWHYNTDNLSNSLLFASVINDINDSEDDPEYYLFNCDTNNKGCIEINNLHIQGQNNTHSCINLVHAGWTFYSNNLTIDNYWYKAINTLTQYDSNIDNLTIERCGKGIYNTKPQYAITLGRYNVTETNTNAIHINNLHMEFCRYYMNFDINQDISINNSI